MYNRYIPQSDGTYRKNPCPDPVPPPRPAPPPPQPIQPPKTIPEAPSNCRPAPPVIPPCRQNQSAASFLRQLLPRNLDTGDLMVVLLLLLIAGDCSDDRNNALITLVLYLIL